MQGYKHQIECSCILPQFMGRPDPPFHRFSVFTVIDDNDNAIPKLAQCNNCGVIHQVTDVYKSKIVVGKETSGTIVTIDEIRLSLPKDL